MKTKAVWEAKEFKKTHKVVDNAKYLIKIKNLFVNVGESINHMRLSILTSNLSIGKVLMNTWRTQLDHKNLKLWREDLENISLNKLVTNARKTIFYNVLLLILWSYFERKEFQMFYLSAMSNKTIAKQEFSINKLAISMEIH